MGACHPKYERLAAESRSAKEHDAGIVGISVLLTTTMPGCRTASRRCGLRACAM